MERQGAGRRWGRYSKLLHFAQEYGGTQNKQMALRTLFYLMETTSWSRSPATYSVFIPATLSCSPEHQERTTRQCRRMRGSATPQPLRFSPSPYSSRLRQHRYYHISQSVGCQFQRLRVRNLHHLCRGQWARTAGPRAASDILEMPDIGEKTGRVPERKTEMRGFDYDSAADDDDNNNEGD